MQKGNRPITSPPPKLRSQDQPLPNTPPRVQLSALRAALSDLAVPAGPLFLKSLWRESSCGHRLLPFWLLAGEGVTGVKPAIDSWPPTFEIGGSHKTPGYFNKKRQPSYLLRDVMSLTGRDPLWQKLFSFFLHIPKPDTKIVPGLGERSFFPPPSQRMGRTQGLPVIFTNKFLGWRQSRGEKSQDQTILSGTCFPSSVHLRVTIFSGSTFCYLRI